jgi:hypothetical protein
MMSLPRWRVMRIFRPRVQTATDLPDEIADHARALAVALANPSTPHDERVALRRAFSKRLSTEVLLTRVAGWDEFHREFWESYEAAAPSHEPGVSRKGGGPTALVSSQTANEQPMPDELTGTALRGPIAHV